VTPSRRLYVAEPDSPLEGGDNGGEERVGSPGTEAEQGRGAAEVSSGLRDYRWRRSRVVDAEGTAVPGDGTGEAAMARGGGVLDG
jgi:hypothetical protein